MRCQALLVLSHCKYWPFAHPVCAVPDVPKYTLDDNVVLFETDNVPPTDTLLLNEPVVAFEIAPLTLCGTPLLKNVCPHAVYAELSESFDASV